MFVGSVYAADDGCNVLLNDSADDVNLLERGDDCQNDCVEIDDNNDDSVVGDLSYCNSTLLDCCNFSGSYLGLELVNSNLTSISGNLFAVILLVIRCLILMCLFL